MLRYSVKIDSSNKDYSEILYDSLYLSPDMNFISGVTSTKYGLIDGQTIMLYSNETDGYRPFPLHIKEVTRRGYVIYEQMFPIYQSQEGEYIQYVDGLSYLIENKMVIVNKIEYEVTATTHVIIPVKYYIDNEKVTINGVEYEVDFNADVPVVILRDETVLMVYNHEKVVGETSDGVEIKKPKTKQVVHFVITKGDNPFIKVDHIHCANNYQYIKYEYTQILGDNTSATTKSKATLYLDNYTANVSGFNDKGERITCAYTTTNSIDKIKVGEEVYELHDEWRNGKSGRKMHFYLDSRRYNVVGGQTLIARPISPQNAFISLLNDGKGLCFHGNYYPLSSDVKKYVKLDENEYPIHEVSGVSYFIYNDVTTNIKISDKKWESVFQYSGMTSYSGDVKEYYYVTIEGKDYIVKEYDIPSTVSASITAKTSGITIYDNIPYTIQVEDSKNGNCLRCGVVCDYDPTDSVMTLVTKQSSYTFELYNPLFNQGNIQPLGYHTRKNLGITYRLFNPQQKVKLPLLVNQNVGLNIRQEDILNSQFVDVEVKKAINPIIDMEKDVYYPYQDNKIVDKIEFYLHFRSRDLDTWKINDDNFTDNQVNDSIDYVKSNWNIFDYYNYSNSTEVKDKLKPKLNLRDYSYYQPSDLLYFLNFTDDDVFYQKKKIEKSFLRLSFYDSKDPYSQSLLHTSTIFMSETALYKKYTDNTIDKGLYVSVDDVLEENKRVFNMGNVSVKYEMQKEEYLSDEEFTEMPEIVMNEENRLSCHMSVFNRFETNESSEGFYMYMFRDYASGLVEKDIYMKVEFCHAGVGRTLNFMLPYKGDGDNKAMLNLSNEDDQEILLKGCKINELYDHLYIPLKCKYNKRDKCYMYYLPDWLVEHNDDKDIMKFNLYEVKLQNESNWDEATN